MNKEFNWGRLVAWGIGALVILIIIFSTLTFVPAGNIGVKTQFGAVAGSYQPGIHFLVPFVDGVTLMNVQTQKDQSDATAASNDLQSVTATIAVNYHVNPTDASTVYQNIGTTYADTVIAPAIQESVKSVTANYTAEQLITEREDVRQNILTLLTTKLQAYGIQMDSLNIVNFAFSSTFNDAIEAKVTAQQDALAAENKVAQATAQASSTVIAANAQAQAIKIQAAAVQSEGGADYVELQAIAKWDGHYPGVVSGSGALPLIQISASK